MDDVPDRTGQGKCRKVPGAVLVPCPDGLLGGPCREVLHLPRPVIDTLVVTNVACPACGAGWKLTLYLDRAGPPVERRKLRQGSLFGSEAQGGGG